MFKGIKKGDSVFYRSSKYSRDKEELTLFVTKITKDTIHTEQDDKGWSIKRKFNILDGEEIINIGSGGNLYPSEQFYLDTLVKKDLIQDIVTLLNSNELSISQLEYFKNELKK